MKAGYLADGTKVHVYKKLEEGYIIQKYYSVYYEEGEDEELTIEKFFADEVFKEAPTPIKDTRILELNKLIDLKIEQARCLDDELSIVAASLRSREKEIEKVNERLKTNKVIENIFSFIDGDFTHFAFFNYDKPVIKTKNEGICEEGEYDRDSKLMTLFGNSKGDLEWKLNQYRDGSGGGWNTCQPCKSEEEAIEFIRIRTFNKMVKYTEGESHHNYASGYVDWMKQNKFDLPNGFIEKHNELESKRIEKNIKYAEEQRDKSNKNIHSMRKQLKALQ